MNEARVSFETKSEDSMFVIVETTELWIVVYHRKTKVMYTATHIGKVFSNFTILVNADGTPMLWDGANE